MRCHSTSRNVLVNGWRAHTEDIMHIPWITCLGSNAIERTQMVSSHLIFYTLIFEGTQTCFYNREKKIEWPFDMRQVLNLWNVSYFKWLRTEIFTSWLRTLAYEMFSFAWSFSRLSFAIFFFSFCLLQVV